MTTSTSAAGRTDDIPPLRRDRAVQAWVLATGVSTLGDVVWLIGLAWTAVHIAGPGAAGLLLGLSTLPKALLVLAGGVWADRADARRIVLGATAARVVVLLVGATVYGRTSAHFAVLACVAVAFGVADGIYTPAAATLPRRMVRAEDLGPVAGMFQTAGRLARLAGAPLGGALVAAFGMRATMLVDAASFLVIGVVMYAAVRPRLPRPAVSGATWARDLTSGLGYVRRSVTVRTLVLALSGLNLFVSPALSVGLALRASGGGWGAGALGVLEAGVGLGAAAGALTATRWRPVRPAITGLLVLVVQGAAIVLLGLGPRWVAGAGVLVVGVTAGLASAFLSGASQALVEPAYLGRTSALTSLADDALMPVAMAGFGALAGLTSVAGACLVAGTAMALLCGWSAARLSPRLSSVPAGYGEVTGRSRSPGSSADSSPECSEPSAARASRTTRMASPPS
jgi:MFS family permease